MHEGLFVYVLVVVLISYGRGRRRIHRIEHETRTLSAFSASLNTTMGFAMRSVVLALAISGSNAFFGSR